MNLDRSVNASVWSASLVDTKYGILKTTKQNDSMKKNSKRKISKIHNDPSANSDSSSSTQPARTKKSAKQKKQIIATENPVLFEKFRLLEAKAHETINARRVFTIIGGFEVIRQCLIDRNWIEKVNENLANPTDNGYENLDRLVDDAKNGNESEKKILSKMVRSSPAHFIWQPKHYQLPPNLCHPLKNRIIRSKVSDFTIKEGLTNLANNIHWYQNEGVSELNYQRTHFLNDRLNRDAFVEDFRLTATSSFLLYLSHACEFMEHFHEQGTISTECIIFAIQKIEHAIKIKDHQDIDGLRISSFKNLIQHKEMYKQFDLVMNHEVKFKLEPQTAVEKLKNMVKLVMVDVNKFFPSVKYDGYRNVWIVKPTNRSCGYGIVVMDNEEKILEYTSKHEEHKYLVQKYIERPLLIQQTKFDIRQYFVTVITSTNIQIWIYKNCYLKFSSQEFNLNDLSASIHLTNHAVQKFFKTCPGRSSEIPDYNMWTLKDFIEYLKTKKKEHLWNEKIFPGIKRNVLAVVLASLEDTELDKNNFELNGADFLLGFDYEPSLLEVNSSPDLAQTTEVTEKICKEVQQDLIKVVVDYNNDNRSSTGEFELIHDCLIPKYSTYSRLSIEGKRLHYPGKRIPLPKLTNFSDLIIEGNKLVRPLEIYENLYPNLKFKKDPGSQMCNSTNESSKRPPNTTTSKYMDCFKVTSEMSFRFLYSKRAQTTNATRNMLKSVTMRPCHDDSKLGYVKKLPPFLQNPSSKAFVNLNDLKNYLKDSLTSVKTKESDAISSSCSLLEESRQDNDYYDDDSSGLAYSSDKSDYDFVDPPCTDHSNVSQTLHQVNLSDFLKQTLDNKYFKSKITSSKI